MALCTSGAAQARPFPNRAAIQAALNAYEACHGQHNQDCHSPWRYRLTRSRCVSLNDPYDPGRILCFYWGSLRVERQVMRLRHDCAYFRPARRTGWRVDAYPDADMCE